MLIRKVCASKSPSCLETFFRLIVESTVVRSFKQIFLVFDFGLVDDIYIFTYTLSCYHDYLKWMKLTNSLKRKFINSSRMVHQMVSVHQPYFTSLLMTYPGGKVSSLLLMTVVVEVEQLMTFTCCEDWYAGSRGMIGVVRPRRSFEGRGGNDFATTAGEANSSSSSMCLEVDGRL